MPDLHAGAAVAAVGRHPKAAAIALAAALAVAALVAVVVHQSDPAGKGTGADAAQVTTASISSVPVSSVPVSSPSMPSATVTASSTHTNRSSPTATSRSTTSSQSQPSTTGHTKIAPTTAAPPTRGGYFRTQPVGAWSSLPGDSTCAALVRRSTWEPRPVNAGANRTMVDPAAVHRAFAARPVGGGGGYDPRWDSWLLQRVDGQFTGTTDEIFQWAACKWGLSDDLLRAIAVRESTWYQYSTYSSGRPVVNWGSGDMMPAGTSGAAAAVYCNGIARYGHDYQLDFGAGICPRTFSIAGVMSWQAPSWGQMPGNQNGTFPFNRDSTAFALDYVASYLRGCYNGWAPWLKNSGNYAAGDMWGCVGSWYSGDWHSSDATGYIGRVQNELRNFTWLQADWPSIRPSCSASYGCPVGR
jgi:hypothetical protein